MVSQRVEVPCLAAYSLSSDIGEELNIDLVTTTGASDEAD
jgi:hypothetical protein